MLHEPWIKRVLLNIQQILLALLLATCVAIVAQQEFIVEEEMGLPYMTMQEMYWRYYRVAELTRRVQEQQEQQQRERKEQQERRDTQQQEQTHKNAVLMGGAYWAGYGAYGGR